MSYTDLLMARLSTNAQRNNGTLRNQIGRQYQEHTTACLVVHWQTLHRQRGGTQSQSGDHWLPQLHWSQASQSHQFTHTMQCRRAQRRPLIRRENCTCMTAHIQINNRLSDSSLLATGPTAD